MLSPILYFFYIIFLATAHKFIKRNPVYLVSASVVVASAAAFFLGTGGLPSLRGRPRPRLEPSGLVFTSLGGLGSPLSSFFGRPRPTLPAIDGLAAASLAGAAALCNLEQMTVSQEQEKKNFQTGKRICTKRKTKKNNRKTKKGIRTASFFGRPRVPLTAGAGSATSGAASAED